MQVQGPHKDLEALLEIYRVGTIIVKYRPWCEIGDAQSQVGLARVHTVSRMESEQG